jgi:hypothetical protein
MGKMKRPSHREINGKLKQAQEVASGKRISFVEPGVILPDLLDLNFLVTEVSDRLPAILSEIQPKDYQGKRPPDKSYERPILDCDLFAFRWSSKVFGCRMYLKYAIKGGYLWIVSLHRHRASEKGGQDELSE